MARYKVVKEIDKKDGKKVYTIKGLKDGCINTSIKFNSLEGAKRFIKILERKEK